MYQIGDIVVYGTEGIAEIGEEIEREFDGQKLKYLVLHPLEKKTETVYVPVGNEKAMRKLRSILSEEEAETLIDALPQERPDWIKNDREGRHTAVRQQPRGTRHGKSAVSASGRAARARQEAACV